MKYKKLQKGIDEIKNIKMTNSEKELIFSNILRSSPQIVKTVKSTWVNFSFLAMLNNNRLVYYIVIPLIIILSSSGVVFASVDSLPDSILYPLKVNVVEPLIEGALTFSPKNKAKYEVNLATKRLVEAETLAGQGKLDKKNEDKINNLLDKHTRALDKTLNDVKKVDKVEQSDKIILNFNLEMNKHSQILENIKNRKNDNNEEDNKISKNARLNAEKINNLSKDKGNHTFNKKELKSEEKNN